jgi:Zn-dependent M16 (insulinase) family peptidase
MALFVLWNYLAESNSAPLYRDFVDLEDPLCAEIYFNIMDMAEIAQVVEFDDVPTEKVDLIKDTFFNAINRICNDIDMERMQTMIKRRIVKHFNAIENSPHGEYSTALIANFLYGRNANDLEESLNPTGTLELLQQQDAQFWSSLIKKYLLDTPHVCVKSNPSEEMGEKLEKAEKDRIKKRKKELGPTRMKALIEDLKKAEAKNAIAIPDELLSNFSVPDVNQVHFFDTTTSRNDLRHEQRESNSKLTKYVNFEQYQVPFFIQFDRT